MGTFGKIWRSKLAVIGAVLVLAALVAGAIGSFADGTLHYSNHWGGLVFAPLPLLIVGLLIAGAIKSPSSRRKPPKLRGRAARKARQAENTTFPIDDYRKW